MSLNVKFYKKFEMFCLNVAFEIPQHGVVALFGPSGSGKTTVLRCVAGLQQNISGSLVIGDDVWFDSERKINLPTHRRSVGYVFQEDNLFSHFSVNENLQFALKRARKNRFAEAIRFDETLKILDIERLLNRAPHSLSGGERQRVALARCLLVNPKLLLLDEPLAALDEDSRQEILHYLERVKNQVKIPILYVSHSTEEIRRIADQIIVIKEGQNSIPCNPSSIPSLGATRSPPVVSVVAQSGMGKTTLIEAVIVELKKRGYKIGVVKHDAHQFEIDHPGKDSFRFSAAGADTMVIASRSKLAMVKQLSQPESIEFIIHRYFSDVDLVLTEGYGDGPFPKILVKRSSFIAVQGNNKPLPKFNILAVASDADAGHTPTHLNLNRPDEVAAFLESQFLTKKIADNKTAAT